MSTVGGFKCVFHAVRDVPSSDGSGVAVPDLRLGGDTQTRHNGRGPDSSLIL